MTSVQTTDSAELYLLAPEGANVKVRDDLLDIKVLQDVDGSGLEQWIPVMKQAFPLSTSDVEKVFDALGVEHPELDRDGYSLDQLLEDLVEPSAAIRMVEVQKRRRRFAAGGCMAELYSSIDAADRRSIVGLQPKRADVILAGACIVRTVMDKLSQESLTVSDRGLRHGLSVERFGAVLTR
jgi:hypothetical protein